MFYYFTNRLLRGFHTCDRAFSAEVIFMTEKKKVLLLYCVTKHSDKPATVTKKYHYRKLELQNKTFPITEITLYTLCIETS